MSNSWERYRAGDPETSKKAAEDVSLTKRQAQVLQILHTRPDYGWIADEIDYHEMGEPGLWRRLNELRKLGLIETRIDRYGEDITRRGRSGKGQRVHWLKIGKTPPPRQPGLF